MQTRPRKKCNSGYKWMNRKKSKANNGIITYSRWFSPSIRWVITLKNQKIFKSKIKLKKKMESIIIIIFQKIRMALIGQEI
jgi:hypothetical protein